MKPGGGRAKGAAGERECAAVFKAHGYDAKRSSPMQAEYPEDYCDLANTGPFAVEVKRLSQAEASRVVRYTREHLAKDFPGLVPLLAYRIDGGRWVACLPLEELLKLIAPQPIPTIGAAIMPEWLEDPIADWLKDPAASRDGEGGE